MNGVLRGRRGARLTALTSGRRDSRQRRLRRDAGAREPARRHGQRGLRRRKPRRRHLPARQHVVPDPARRGGPRARRGCARPGADDSVLARRSAGPHRRAVAGGVAAARRGDRPHRRRRRPGVRRRASRRDRAGSHAGPRPSSSTISPSRARRSARCRRRTHRARALLRRIAAACSSSFTRRYGSRINRAWGLALRKRFCVKFNFELQAAATEDAIVLSLSTSHSFELAAVARYLHSNTVRDVLIQAMLDAPMFAARWRWIAGHLARAAALPRRQEGARAAAADARRGPDGGGVSRPDRVRREHCRRSRDPGPPARRQTIHDCLHEAMDIDGLERLLRRIESGRDRRRRARPVDAVAARARDSDRAALCLSRRRAARGAPHAGGDGTALARRGTASDLGQLDAAAIDRVRAEAWPEAANADELHDALLGLGVPHGGRSRERRRVVGASRRARPAAPRHTRVRLTTSSAAAIRDLMGRRGAVAAVADRLPGRRRCRPIDAPEEFAARTWTRDAALVEIVRSRLEGIGTGHERIDREPRWACRLPTIDAALAALAAEGVAMSGRVHAGGRATEWCDRALLARIHRYTVKRLRQEIEPVSDAGLHALSVPLAARRAQRAPPGSGRARRGDRATAGFRGAGRGVGSGDPAGASRRLRLHVARRSVPFRPRRLDAPDAAGAPASTAQCRADPHDAGRAAAAAHRAALESRRARAADAAGER